MNPRDESIKVHYVGDARTLRIRLIYSWHRGDIDGPVMSTSSGPKAYVKNQVWTLFSAVPNAVRVIAVRASGPMFFLIQDDTKCCFDVTGKQGCLCEGNHVAA